MKTIIQKAQYQCKYCQKIFNDRIEAIKCEKNCFKIHNPDYQRRNLINSLKTSTTIKEIINICISLKNITKDTSMDINKLKKSLQIKFYSYRNNEYEFEDQYFLNCFFDKYHISLINMKIYNNLKELNKEYKTYKNQLDLHNHGIEIKLNKILLNNKEYMNLDNQIFNNRENIKKLEAQINFLRNDNNQLQKKKDIIFNKEKNIITKEYEIKNTYENLLNNFKL